MMEAGSNSFEMVKRLGSLSLKACVLESCHVGRHAKIYADNTKVSAARIALVYLAGNAPCIWVPDEKSRQQMLRCMRVLGVGIVNAFALLAVIGDIRRFHSPEKLVAYIGLNPGRRQSGMGKDIRLDIGQRGRGDIRRLLIQGPHTVLRCGKKTALEA